MKNLFCNTKTKSNEEHKKVIENRMKRFLLICVIGIVTGAVPYLVKIIGKVNVSDHILAFYFGVGTAFIVAGICLWRKDFLLLKSEEKIKEDRLKCCDERLNEIKNKSFRIASYFLLFIIYSLCLFGGLFYPMLTKLGMILIYSFGAIYFIANKIYERKM